MYEYVFKNGIYQQEVQEILSQTYDTHRNHPEIEITFNHYHCGFLVCKKSLTS